MQEDKCYSMKIWTEKLEGHGEDAPPLLISKGETFAVAVFDGMGGAGAATCNSDFGEGYTKAYVASRIVSSAVHIYLDNHLPTDDISKEDFRDVIIHRLRAEQEKYPSQKTGLRSKLVRDYPTTMAAVIMTEHEKRISIDSYWAGDSRCYFWTKDGFYQISEDDLEEKNDPMENLHNDSPISNCICADRDFQINHKHIDIDIQPIIVLCATDGCFGYYPTPMHFEYILKKSLQEAKDESDWQTRVEKSLLKVTGDDTSLALVGVGYDSFKQFKSMANKPIEGIDKIRKHESRMAQLKRELAQEKDAFVQSTQSGWERYKRQYMKHLND